MSEATIPVDFRNPGQVFACLGLMEAAERIMDAPCECRFNYESGETRGTFTIKVAKAGDPIGSVVEFLHSAKIAALVPAGMKRSTKRSKKEWEKDWNLAEVLDAEFISAGVVPGSRAKLPAIIEFGNARLTLDHWADGPQSGRDPIKLWGGMQGKPGAAVAQDILQLISELEPKEIVSAVLDPFSLAKPLKSGFRLDWRRDYIALDAGFSPNRHKTTITMVGYPLTEILAAIGLQNARPVQVSRRDKLQYRYGVSSALLPTSLARVVLGAADVGFPLRSFRMVLGWPGKKNQARCIIDAFEEV